MEIKEEKVIIDILFEQKKLDRSYFKNINYNKLINVASSHLMIPALYFNINKKKYSNYVPKKFQKYILEIFQLNCNRNIILKEEIIEISRFLNKHKKRHVFLKGSAHIFSNIYENIGERMVGDIDILCDFEESNEVYYLLKKNGYLPSGNLKFFSNKHNLHFPRQIKNKKLFSVEVHKRLFKNKNILFEHSKSFLENGEKKYGIYVPSLKNQLIHNIYNFQINDLGSHKLSYSFRSLYDTLMLLKFEKKSLSKFDIDFHLKNYFMVAKMLGISELNTNEIKSLKINEIRFILKKKNKFYQKFENFVIKQLIMLKWRPLQAYKFLTDKNYRYYIKYK